MERGLAQIHGAEVIMVALRKRRIAGQQRKGFCFLGSRAPMGTIFNGKAVRRTVGSPSADDKVSGVRMPAQFNQIPCDFIEERMV